MVQFHCSGQEEATSLRRGEFGMVTAGDGMVAISDGQGCCKRSEEIAGTRLTGG